MLVSCHSFIRMARLAGALMEDGGSLMILLTYDGAPRVVERCNAMGPVTAALEASVRYLAHEHGQKELRVNAISTGTIKTSAASGITQFEGLLDEPTHNASRRRVVDAREVGRVALLPASHYAAAITGEVIHVDAGYHIEGMVFH